MPRTGTLTGSPVPDEVKDLYKTAPEIPADHHIRMQAAFQKHVDNAVSKTVNLPEDASAEDIGRIYLLARSLGCKGGSRCTGTTARKTRCSSWDAPCVAMIF